MKCAHPLPNDELQMRAFWRQWHELITLSPAAHTPARRIAAV
jgi:hypothetical protein